MDLCSLFTLTPTLIFFAHKAYYVWDRSLFILITSLSVITIHFCLECGAAGVALPMQAGFRDQSNEAVIMWLPVFFSRLEAYTPLRIAAASAQLGE
jgi:hypothetical protein